MSFDQKSRLLSPPTSMKSWSSLDLPPSYQLHMPVAEYLCQTCGLRIRKEHWITHAQVHELISKFNPISAPPTSTSKLNLSSSSSQMVSSKPYSSHSIWPPSLSVDYAHFLHSQLGTSPLPEKVSKSPSSPTSVHASVPSLASNTDLSSAFSILKHHTNALQVLTSDYGSPQLESRRTNFVTTSDAQIAMQKLLQIQNHLGSPPTSSPLSSRSEAEEKIGLRQPKRSRCEQAIGVDRKKRWRCELFPPVLHSRRSSNQSPFPSFVEPRLFIKPEPTHASSAASPAPILSSPVSHDPFVCPDCGKGFTRNSNLTRHRRIHSGEKRFGCSDCKKHFMEKHHLIAHIRTHTGERPFQCRACARRFTDRSNMLRHLRTHSHLSGRMSGPELLLECGGSDDEFGTMPRPDMNIGAGNLPGSAHDQDSGDEDSEDEITRATLPSTTLPTQLFNAETRQTDDLETTPPLGPTKARIRFDLPPKDLFPSSSPASLLVEKENSSSTDSKTLSTSCNSGLTPIMGAMDINRVHLRTSNESGDLTQNSKVKTIEDESVCNSEPPAFTLPPTRTDNLAIEIDQKLETGKSRKQSPCIGDFEKSLQDVLEGFSLLQEPPQIQLSLSSMKSDINPPRLSVFSNSRSNKSDQGNKDQQQNFPVGEECDEISTVKSQENRQTTYSRTERQLKRTSITDLRHRTKSTIDDAMEKKRLFFSEESYGGLDAIAACAAVELQALHLRPPLSLPPLKQKRKQEQQKRKLRSKSIPDKTTPKTKSNKLSPKKIPEQLRRSRSSSVKNQKTSQ